MALGEHSSPVGRDEMSKKQKTKTGLQPNSPKTRLHPNSPKDGVSSFLIAAAFGLVMYVSGGNSIIDQATAKRQVLRVVRDQGVSTIGKEVSKDRGYKYFDKKLLREVRPSDSYLSFAVGNQTIEVEARDWGSISGDRINIRYLPSDPEVLYYTNEPDVLKSIQDEIWYRTLELIFVWAVVLVPSGLGLFVLLICVVPDNLFGLLFAILAAVGSFVAAYLYAVC